MRPALKPGLLPVWRNRDTMQIGIDPRRAIALTGMRGAAGLLRLLDGSRDRGQVLAAARDLGIDPAAADQVMSLLALGFALARELSGEAQLQRTAEPCHCAKHSEANPLPSCAKAPDRQSDQQRYLAMTEQRFNGIRQCC